MSKFSIVIPVYNESKNLPLLIPEIYKVLKKEIFELIIVDDNSSDNTSKIIKNFKKKNLKHIIRRRDRDLIKSCILGFKNSKYDKILVMDGDLQHRPKDILKFLYIFKKYNADIVVGTRNLFKNKTHNLSIIRLTASRILILLVNLLLGNRTSDPMSGFFLFKKKIFLENQSKLFKKGYKILLDLIYTNKSKYKICDVQINFDSRKKGRSKMNLKVVFFLILMIFSKFYGKFV